MANPVFSAPHFHNEEAAFAYVEAHLWPEGPVCPHCGNCDDKQIGRLSGKIAVRACESVTPAARRSRCGSARIFEDSHFPLHLWLQAIQLITREQEGHLHPPNSADVQLQHENRLVSDAPYPRDHEPAAGVPPLGGEGETLEADVTYVGRKPGSRSRRGAGRMPGVRAR